MSDTNKCHEEGCCRSMGDRLVDSGKGLHALHTVNRDDPNNTHTRFLGVAYKTSAKDKGLLLNWCPWCGGQPGYFKRVGGGVEVASQTLQAA